MTMFKRPMPWLVGGGITALLTVLFVQTQTVNLEQHNQIMDSLRQLKQLEATLNQDILRLRFGLLQYYDPVTQTLSQLETVHRRLQTGPLAIYREGEEDIDRQIEGYAQVLKQKVAITEEFISENSTLNNSLRYFPIATTRLVGRVKQRSDPAGLDVLLNGLLKDVLLYNLAPAKELQLRVRSLLDTLVEKRRDLPSEWGSDFDLVMAHAELILRQKDTVDGLLGALLSTPDVSRLDSLQQAYLAHYARTLRRANIYRLILYLVCVLLVGFIGHMILRLKERTQTLFLANQQLEGEITERKRVEKTLEVAYQELKESLALKDELIAKVSHELRTPLTSIKEGLSLLLDNALGETGAEQRDFLATMDKDVERLSNLITNMLDFSKIEAGRLLLHRRRVDPRSLVDTTIRSYRALAGSRQVSTEYDADAMVFVDADRMLQVLGHLFSNAIKFTEADDTVTCRVRQQDGEVAVSIEDTGCGIAPEDLPKLFQRFSQVGARDPNQPRGTGLGLAIAKELVELQGGRIQVTSSLGHGSTFTVELPAYTDECALSESFRELQALAAPEKGKTVGVIAIRARSDPQGLERLADGIRSKIHQDDVVLTIEPEWIVVLAATYPGGVQAIIRRLREAYPNQPLEFGAAIYPSDGAGVRTLFEHATHALDQGLAV